jgi:hypothetical protein
VNPQNVKDMVADVMKTGGLGQQTLAIANAFKATKAKVLKLRMNK